MTLSMAYESKEDGRLANSRPSLAISAVLSRTLRRVISLDSIRRQVDQISAVEVASL